VSVTKTIFSHEVSSSIYKYIAYKTLLQAEGGYSTNEPSQLAVKEAIESAVIHLTLQGVRDRAWAFRDESAWQSPLVQSYMRDAELQIADPEVANALNTTQVPMRSSSLVLAPQPPIAMVLPSMGQVGVAVAAAQAIVPVAAVVHSAKPVTVAAPAPAPVQDLAKQFPTRAENQPVVMTVPSETAGRNAPYLASHSSTIPSASQVPEVAKQAPQWPATQPVVMRVPALTGGRSAPYLAPHSSTIPEPLDEVVVISQL
jgi:hypothetical protein